MNAKRGPNRLKLILLAAVAALALTCVGMNCSDHDRCSEMLELIIVAGAAGAAIGALSSCEKLLDRPKADDGGDPRPEKTECVTLLQLRRESLREAEIGLAAGILIVIGYTFFHWLC